MENRAGEKRCARCGGELPEGARCCLRCGETRDPRPAVSTRVFPLRPLFWIPVCLLAAILAVTLPLLSRRPLAEAVRPAETGAPASGETDEALKERETEAAITIAVDGGAEAPVSVDEKDGVQAGSVSDGNPASPSSSAAGETPPAGGAEKSAPAAHVHDYKRTVTRKATCDADGSATLVCAGCGDTRTEVLPKGHSTRDGVCALCGLYCYGDNTVKLINDLSSELDNYYMCSTPGSFQSFRMISCGFYTADGVLRARGNATAVSPATYDDTCLVHVFYAGQNKFGSPLRSGIVTVISAGVNEGLTKAYDVPVANWSDLTASGKTAFEVHFALKVD